MTDYYPDSVEEVIDRSLHFTNPEDILQFADSSIETMDFTEFTLSIYKALLYYNSYLVDNYKCNAAFIYNETSRLLDIIAAISYLIYTTAKIIDKDTYDRLWLLRAEICERHFELKK